MLRKSFWHCLPLLSFCLLSAYSCRAFGNFWENNKEERTTYNDPSDPVPPTAPGSPAAVNGGSTQINLSWTAATDNVTQPSALIYEICQSTSAGGCATFTATFVTAAGAASFNAPGLNPSTTYYYRIRARDTANNAGIETAEFSATTAAPGIVNTPTYSPVAGTYSSGQNVSISTSTGGAIICYTNDGVTTPTCNATPSCTVGSTYGAAINVSTTTTLKAIACKNGSTDSSVANAVFTIDSSPPTVTGVTSSTTNGTLGVGQTISIQVNFNETVNVTGTPQLTLSTGSPATTAVNYVSGSGTATLNFDYVTVSGNFSADLDYANTGALSLNGGSIQDLAGNAAVLTLASPGTANSLGSNKSLIIDGVGPAVSGVTSSTADGTYTTSNVITIQVNFNEAVTVTGTPQLTLATGSPPATAVNYASGSGSTTLIFNYTITAGNSSADLDYMNTAALALNGGTINDASGNAASLTLVTPGAVGSIGNSKNIVVDTGGLTPGTALSFNAISSTGMTLNWGAATDDITAQVGLQYKVVKDNASLTNIDTVVEVNTKTAPDLLQDWAASITTLPVTGLSAGTTYHFAVLVRDGAGNMALYTPASQATSGGGMTRQFVVNGGTTSTSIYDSGTHSFSAGPALGFTASTQGYSFPINSGAQAGKIMVVIGAGTNTRLYDPVGNTFAAGPTITGAGAGAHSFAITSGANAGKQFSLRGGGPNSVLYDPAANTFTAGLNVSFTHAAGGHSFAITTGPQAGKMMLVHAGGNIYTSLFDPTLAAGSYAAGPDLSAAAGAGAHAFAITSGIHSGKTMIVHANSTMATSIYDPATNTMSGGPTLSPAPNTGAHAIAINTGPQAGKILVILGNTNSTAYYDPGTNSFSGGPTTSGTVGAGGHAFSINAGLHAGKTLVVHGNTTNTTSLFDPSGPTFTGGPTLSSNAGAGTHSWALP